MSPAALSTRSTERYLVLAAFLTILLLAGCGSNPIAVAHRSPTSTTTPRARRLAVSTFSGVSCADSIHCWVGALTGKNGDDAEILATSDGGTTWTVQETLRGVDDIGSIACPSVTHCLAAGDRADTDQAPLLLSTTDGGRSWSARSMPKDVSELDAISCVNDLDCWLVGAQPDTGNDVVLATTDWGRSWTVQDRSSIGISMGVSYAVSCASTDDCVIVGFGGLTTGDAGLVWKKHSIPGDELNAVSCPSDDECVAEGEVTSALPADTSTDIATSNDGGASWRLQVAKLPGGVGDLGSLSCPTTTTCVSVGSGYSHTREDSYSFWGAVEKSSDGGQTWAGVKVPETSSLNAVSCATGTTDCIAVGEVNDSSGVILKSVNDGSTWTTESLASTSW